MKFTAAFAPLAIFAAHAIAAPQYTRDVCLSPVTSFPCPPDLGTVGTILGDLLGDVVPEFLLNSALGIVNTACSAVPELPSVDCCIGLTGFTCNID